MTDSVRSELLAGAKIIEMETQGRLPAAGFVKLIDKGIVPAKPHGDLFAFLPMLVRPDQSGSPTGSDALHHMEMGCLAVYPDRVLGAWIKGLVRARVTPFSFDRSAVSSVKVVGFGEVPGIDLTLRDATVTIAFPPSVPTDLARSWRDELAGLLDARKTLA